MKTTDTIVFHFKGHFPFYSRLPVYLERMLNDRREQICRFDVSFPTQGGELVNVYCSSHYENRVSMVLIHVNASTDDIEFDVTISKAEKPDNGTYMIWNVFLRPWKCFTVYILGRYSLCPKNN